MKEIEIRPSELAKVPLYTEKLKKVVSRSKEIGEEKAFAELEKEIFKRDKEWFEKHKDNLSLKGTEVRKGFQLVLLKYMGLKKEELLIMEETEKKITWHSYTFCPYLSAIKNLRLDTKKVCKLLTEKRVQVLLNLLNPKLRFSRNYEKIRPYEDYCEETIELVE